MKITLTNVRGEAKLVEGVLAVAIATYPVTAAAVAFVLGLVVGHVV